jgi:hypothetical protein
MALRQKIRYRLKGGQVGFFQWHRFDKAGRYLIKRDPAGFFAWLLRRPAVTFRIWIDARRQALPDQGDMAVFLSVCELFGAI